MDTTTVTLTHASFEKGDVVFYGDKPYVVVSAHNTTVTLRPARMSRLYFTTLALIFCLTIALVVWSFTNLGGLPR